MWTIEFNLITTLLVSENPDLHPAAGKYFEAPAAPTPAGPGPTPRS